MKRAMLTVLLAGMMLSTGCAKSKAKPEALKAGETKAFSILPDWCPNPDGVTVDKNDPTIMYLNSPNFVPNDKDEQKCGPDQKKKTRAVLCKVDPEGNVTKLWDYTAHPVTGWSGPMALDQGSDGNLYIADNQYFYAKNNQSRVLRIVMENGKAIREEVVATGLKLSNAVMIKDDKVYISDTFFDVNNKEGNHLSGIYCFDIKELDAAKPVAVKPFKSETDHDSHLVCTLNTRPRSRGDIAGADGIAFDKQGLMYCGAFGDGRIWQFTLDAAGKKAVSSKVLIDDKDTQCCDGMRLDPEKNIIYFCDSQGNAIKAFTPSGQLWTVAQNGDNDGSTGLDQPAEVIIFAGQIVAVNFDFSFPGLTNTGNDKPYSLTAMGLEAARAGMPKPAAK
ncbi:MAG: hypothetical protein HN909_06405 [Phycisphaerales bacterium]|jgi:hypothetical protein|nr:hypothetical protein [Phycisphaerales bacterium]MBT7171384.1 hypothetical protein [Phycisphaerales bacterium]